MSEAAIAAWTGIAAGGPAAGGLAQAGTALAVATAAFTGPLASGLTGAGAGVILSFALAPLIGVAALVQTVGVAMVVSHIARVRVFREAIDRKVCALILLPALPGCVLGSLVYVQLDERAIATVLGLFLLGVVPLKRVVDRHRTFVAAPWVLGLGTVAFGFLSGTTIGGGVLVLPILSGAGLTGERLVGTDAAVGLAVHLTKMVVFGTAAMLTADLAFLGLVVGICMIPGAFLAKTIIRRMPLRVHAGLIDAVILSGGIAFLGRALAA